MNDLYLRRLDAARRRVSEAKEALTAATEAIHRREPGAAEQADQALAELNAARSELRRLTDMAPGPWAIAARARDDR